MPLANNSPLAGALDVLRRSGNVYDRANGDNFAFEERVSAARWVQYKAIAAGKPVFEQGHAAYVKQRVILADRSGVSATFDPDNSDALLPKPGEQVLVRVETLDRIAGNRYGAAGGQTILHDLLTRRGAGDPGVAAELAKFVEAWNLARDARPMFAACLDEVRAAADAADWAVKLRAQLGLGHLSAAPDAPMLLVQMRYRVSDVLNAAEDRRRHLFAAPTVLDGSLSPYFYPSPKPRAGIGGSYGRTVHLEDSPPLVAELLNFRIDYRLEQIYAVTELVDGLPIFAQGRNLPGLRNGHLARVRAEAGRDDFAEPMVL